MENYQILGRIGEGAHGIVLKAKHITVSNHNLLTLCVAMTTLLTTKTGELVALKKIPLKKVDDGIPNSALRYQGACINLEYYLL